MGHAMQMISEKMMCDASRKLVAQDTVRERMPLRNPFITTTLIIAVVSTVHRRRSAVPPVHANAAVLACDARSSRTTFVNHAALRARNLASKPQSHKTIYLRIHTHTVSEDTGAVQVLALSDKWNHAMLGALIFHKPGAWHV